MPRVRRENLPRALWAHLLARMDQREISLEQLYLLSKCGASFNLHLACACSQVERSERPTRSSQLAIDAVQSRGSDVIGGQRE